MSNDSQKESAPMITENNLPSLAHDLVRIHKVITRGLSIGVERGAEFIQAGFPNPTMRQGFADYIRSLAIVLDAHHLSEDESAFPAFQKKLPLAPYKHLLATHKEIEALLTPVIQAVADGTGAGIEASLPFLVGSLRKITVIWAPHIRMEESIFSLEALSTEPLINK